MLCLSMHNIPHVVCAAGRNAFIAVSGCVQEAVKCGTM